MNEWFEASIQALDRMAEALEKQLVTAVDQTIEATDDAIDRLNQQISDAIPPETIEQFEQQVEKFEDSIEEAGAQTAIFLEEALRPVSQTLNPVINNHGTCIGCRNYEGSEFGGNMLVCGMHPYGCQAEKCPDYEAVWTA